jgi:hypothetical protein
MADDEMLDNEMYVIENPLQGETDPDKLRLSWQTFEEPGEAWFNLNNTWARMDERGRIVDANGFMLDSVGKQMKDKDDNFMLSKDFPVETK